MPVAADPPDPSSPDTITCRVTPWYYRRMGLLAALLAGLGLYFLYDGQIGYPKSNALAAEKERFEKEVVTGYTAAKDEGCLELWMQEARAKGWPTGTDTRPPRWATWAAERGLPENPHPYTDAEIAQQFWFGGACLAGALVVLIVIALNCRKTLRADLTKMVTADGAVIPFDQVFRLDIRKWPQKGLAYAWYRPTPGAAERRATLDDLKFSGTAAVLERLRARFKGELLEKVVAPEAEPGDGSDTEVSKDQS